MGLNPQQFRSLVIRPTLRRLDLWSEAAEELLLGTAIQESARTTCSRWMVALPWASGKWSVLPTTTCG